MIPGCASRPPPSSPAQTLSTLTLALPLAAAATLTINPHSGAGPDPSPNLEQVRLALTELIGTLGSQGYLSHEGGQVCLARPKRSSLTLRQTQSKPSIWPSPSADR